MKIPHNRAIQLLEERLRDLEDFNINLEAFRNRVRTDIMKIYGSGQESIKSITLPTPNTYTKEEEISKMKEVYRQTLNGWIQSIKDFHLIDQEVVEQTEKEFESKYINLLGKWNELVPDYNQLLKDNEKLHSDYDKSLSEIKILRDKLNNQTTIEDVIKILFLGASPVDEVKLRIDEEVRDIEEGLQMATLRDNFSLKTKWAVTSKSLQQAMLDEQPEIVQFSGHGDIDGIAVEDSLGNSKLIDNDAIGSLFELFSDKVKCVFLNSCYSESQATEISKHIPFVIGMKSSVNDKAAIAFSVGFYSALGAGKDIAFAFKMGVVAIKMEGITGSDIPILIG